MNILEIAKEHAVDGVIGRWYQFENNHLQAFATAIAKQAVEEYKAGLVPSAYLVTGENGAYWLSFNETWCVYGEKPLYALPNETK